MAFSYLSCCLWCLWILPQAFLQEPPVQWKAGHLSRGQSLAGDLAMGLYTPRRTVLWYEESVLQLCRGPVPLDLGYLSVTLAVLPQPPIVRGCDIDRKLSDADGAV
ncbi:hypothetical protein F5X97DRAFT_318061 [Nemania serpens]|nr:hypothetical protein F5X97DRAFT_318061 [Nemania serpens]